MDSQPTLAGDGASPDCSITVILYHFIVPGAEGQLVETKGFKAQGGISLQWLNWKGTRTGLIRGRDFPGVVSRNPRCSCLMLPEAIFWPRILHYSGVADRKRVV